MKSQRMYLSYGSFKTQTIGLKILFSSLKKEIKILKTENRKNIYLFYNLYETFIYIKKLRTNYKNKFTYQV